MSKAPDFAAFSRFRDLNIKSLLYYQAQLTTLRKKLHRQEYKDSSNRSDVDADQYAERADILMSSEESAQFELITKMRGLLKEYTCLLPVVAITVLSQLHGYRDLLLCLAGFVAIFALGLIFLTSGTTTRVEIFTATAA
ncbi:hypothetical protein AOQ84DRAFT_287605 [Glonium stellatum]|uniref:DUF6594 domain-containing protein n=1 Tax=Glonium stellatum TaxID=574774 RepID=A0A8E2F6D2_9PEZI|nr:hypothetical protein AOQ84DRAFT_287605 [Glonium stellatum]